MAESRALLEAAFDRFSAQGERLGELLCLAAIIESFYVDEGPLEPLDGWIERLGHCLPDGHGRPAWPSDEL